jgi:hypothetical protein
MSKLPSQSYLQSRIYYNPETGEARWKTVDESYGPAWKGFNARYANKSLSRELRIHGKTYSTAYILYKMYHGTEVDKLRYVNKDSLDYSISNLVPMHDIDAKVSAAPSGKAQSYKPIPTECFELLRYDHKTGELFWNPRGNKSWDARYANTIAGYTNSRGYVDVKVSIDGCRLRYKAHRISWLLYYGVDPVNYQIDHIDGCKNNNCIKNLRLADSSFNVQAAAPAKRFNFRINSGKYQSTISIQGKQIQLGTFDTEEQARAAYESAIQRYKPVYTFTDEEQATLDELYDSYPNASAALQRAAHNLQLKAIHSYNFTGNL